MSNTIYLFNNWVISIHFDQNPKQPFITTINTNDIWHFSTYFSLLVWWWIGTWHINQITTLRTKTLSRVWSELAFNSVLCCHFREHKIRALFHGPLLILELQPLVILTAWTKKDWHNIITSYDIFFESFSDNL